MVCESPMLERVTMHTWSNTNRTWNTPLFTLMIEGLIGIELMNGVAALCLIKHLIDHWDEITNYDIVLDGSIKHRNRRTNYYMPSMLAWLATILQDFGEADQMKSHVAFLNQQFRVTRSSRWYSIPEQPFWTSIHLRILNQSFKVEGNQNGAGVPNMIEEDRWLTMQGLNPRHAQLRKIRQLQLQMRSRQLKMSRIAEDRK